MRNARLHVVLLALAVAVMVPALLLFTENSTTEVVAEGGKFSASYSGDGSLMAIAIQYIFPILFTVLFWKYKAATPGKMVMGLSVVDAKTGEPLSTGQAIGRYFAYIISSLALCLGYVWVVFDDRKQGWHDKLAGTVVIRTK